MRKQAAIVILAVAVLIDREAAAEERPKRPYVVQIAAMDGGALLAGAVLEQPFILVGGYMLGSPIIHWAHGNVVEGFMSLALRVVAPTVLGFAAKAGKSGSDDDAAVYGVVAGVIVASTLDAALLANPPQRSIAVIAGRF